MREEGPVTCANSPRALRYACRPTASEKSEVAVGDEIYVPTPSR